MQVTRLRIENFRGIRELDVNFLDEWTNLPRSLTLFLGANGTGKTTVLQAIALTLSLATRKTSDPASFLWPGFLIERISSLGRTRVELDLRFDTRELEETSKLYDFWVPRVRSELVVGVARPGQLENIRIIYDDGILSSVEGPEALSQCLGRYFIRYLSRSHGTLRSNFPFVGDVFWFDQHRSLKSVGDESARGIDILRKYLVGWWAFHTSPGKTDARDFLPKLETLFARLFPGTRFVGVDPRPSTGGPDAEDPYVLMEREGKVYDIAEMSSGEQAVFPLLYEFVRLNIARSVVLIDELELHLHPPQQQSLNAALRTIGPDCQFIVTTHSPYLESVTPQEEEVRLPGGQQCL